MTATHARRTSFGRNTALGAVGGTAAMKIGVLAAAGIFGIVNTHLIITHFGSTVYAQYGLLASMPGLLPFADLGVASVVINAIAISDDPSSDPQVRRTLTTAIRMLLMSGGAIVFVAVMISGLGLWPSILGGALVPGQGSVAAFLCLALFGMALPLSLGTRILTGLGRTTSQTAADFVASPLMFTCLIIFVLTSIPAGPYIAVISYVAIGMTSFVCLRLAAGPLGAQIRAAIREVPHCRRYPGVKAINTAWPMVVQMVALPIAMQTDRLLLSHQTHGSELAQYNLASQLFGVILQVIAAAGLALWPIFARSRSKDAGESPMRTSGWFAAAGFVAACCLAAVAPFAVDVIADGRIRLSPSLLIAFVVFVALQAAKYPVGMYMTDRRGLTFQVAPILIMIPLNLALSWRLIGVLGAAGPVVGSAVAVALCQVIPNFWYVHRERARRARSAVPRPAEVGLQ